MEEISFISERMIKEVKRLLENELAEDEEAIKIAKNIFEKYVRGGSRAVREYLNNLMEEEESNANFKRNKSKRI